MLLFIAFFVWIGAAQEASATQMRSQLAGVPVTHAMQTRIHVLTPDAPLSRAVELILGGPQQDFPVVDAAGNIVGVLAQEDLMVALAKQELSAPIASVMNQQFCAVDEREMLERAVARLGQQGGRSAPVLRNGVLVGLLTQDNIGEYVTIQAALRAKASQSAPMNRIADYPS
jgi:CBS-domain-containing membrane protein